MSTTDSASAVFACGFLRGRRRALRGCAATSPCVMPESGKNLREVLDGLPPRWFSDRMADAEEELDERVAKDLVTLLEPKREEERKKRRPGPSERRERSPLRWSRTIRYVVALLRYRRPDFDDHEFEGQLDLLDQCRRYMNSFLEEQKKLTKYVEYGNPTGIPRAVERARDQVRAAVLADVEGLSHREIADALGEDVPGKYEVNMKAPTVGALVRDGRSLLQEALRETGQQWPERAEEMKAEGERYGSLSEAEKEVERLAENTGWSLERARYFYRANPDVAKFLIWASDS